MKYLNQITTTAVALALLSGCGGEEKKTGTRADAPKTVAEAPAKATPAEAAPAAEKKSEPVKTGEEKKPDEKKAETSPSDTKPASGDAGSIAIGDRSIVVPGTWKQEAPSSNMRVAQFRIPKTGNDADDGDLAIIKLPAGGGVDANLKRWIGQFGGEESLKAKRTVKTAAGVEATVAELEGTYTAMTMAGTGEPKKGYKMLGAIVITDKGEFYFKFAAPQATADANKAAFDKMIESFK